MIKLTDLDICKRIAEIEGLDFYLLESGEDVYPLIKVWSDPTLTGKDVPKKFFTAHDYNPLTDDALCFRFCYEEGIVIKKCSVVADNKIEWDGKYYARHPKNKNFGTVDESPRKAVCLEYIEAHKENV